MVDMKENTLAIGDTVITVIMKGSRYNKVPVLKITTIENFNPYSAKLKGLRKTRFSDQVLKLY